MIGTTRLLLQAAEMIETHAGVWNALRRHVQMTDSNSPSDGSTPDLRAVADKCIADCVALARDLRDEAERRKEAINTISKDVEKVVIAPYIKAVEDDSSREPERWDR